MKTLNSTRPKKQKVYNIAFFVSHPIQYQVPLLRLIEKHSDINLHVYFLSDQSTETYFDVGFNKKIKWDIPLTGGYPHEFLPSVTNPGDFSWFNPRVNRSKLREVFAEREWDGIWIHGYNNLALLYVIWLCRKQSIPLIFTADSTLASSHPSTLKDMFIRILVKQAHALMWVSSDNLDYYRHYGASESQLFSMPFSVDNTFFQSYQSATSEIQQTEKCILLYAAKFIPRKQAPLLVQAFADLAPEVRQQAQLWLVGDGVERAKIETIIEQRELGDQVKLLGFKNQTELPEYMAACDVFVLPSEREPFGLVINEVMNFAKAIITTNEVGAARDLVANGDNGWVIPAGDLSALKAALSEAILDRAQLRAMGKRSLARINKWSYAEDIKGLLAALKAIKQ